MYIAIGPKLLEIIELYGQVILELALLFEDISLIPIRKVPLIRSQRLALVSLKPVCEPIARHTHGFGFEDPATPQQEQLLNQILLIADVPAPRADGEDGLS